MDGTSAFWSNSRKARKRLPVRNCVTIEICALQ